MRDVVFDNGERTLIINAPADKMAVTSGENWSPEAPALPAFLQVFKTTWTPLTQPGSAESSVSSCRQLVLLAQAKPEKYEFSIWVYVPEASMSVEPLANRFQVFLTAGFQTNCALRKR